MKRRILVILAVIAGLVITGALVTASIWPVIDDVKTGATPEYPKVLPQYFSADPGRVYDEAVATVKSLDRWQLVLADGDKHTITATRTSRLGFVDDVKITVKPQTEFVTRVDVRSHSRVGKGDFGQNARNIRTFQTELEHRLGAVRFDPYATDKKSAQP